MNEEEKTMIGVLVFIFFIFMCYVGYFMGYQYGRSYWDKNLVSYVDGINNQIYELEMDVSKMRRRYAY